MPLICSHCYLLPRSHYNTELLILLVGEQVYGAGVTEMTVTPQYIHGADSKVVLVPLLKLCQSTGHG